ncbi:phage terminase large subunit [Algicola sagamiensis]|uniref:phage terminase large subunit n=1 Tax=Algicola sagamiensis TaxID=163869 RepID=UPI00146A129A|nr:phage terminase large subunit [Algicola sagamiensis]
MKKQYLALLEAKLAKVASRSLDAYCRYIEIPGVPVNDDDDCELFYPDNVEPAQHHQLINQSLEKVESGEIKRLMVFMPPGSAKSTYATVVFPTWFMGKNPKKNIINTSYGSDLARKFGRKCRQITRSPAYQRVFNTGLTEDNKAVDNWSLTNESTYMAGGILSGITGNRADGLIIDDPVKGREQAESETIRNKTWEAYLSDLRTRLKPNGWIIVILTRWHEDDLAGRILPNGYAGESGTIQAKDGEDWHVICLQAQCERDDDPLKRKQREYLWTEWFSEAHWKQERITQGSRNWDALYQQRPSPAEGGMIKRTWVSRYRVPPANPIRIVQSWDTANKANEINDPSVCTTWAETKLAYYLLDVWCGKVEFPTLKSTAISLAQKWQPSAILIEDKASGQSLIQEFKANTRLPVIAIEPEGDKITRMSAESAKFEAGKVFMPEAASWLPDYEREIFAFPLCEHDDQVDSTSQFLKWASSNQQHFAYEKVKPTGLRKGGAW